MRRSLALSPLILFACSSIALAVLPLPPLCGVGNNVGSTPCHHKFTNHDSPGSLGDTLIVYVTLRDEFANPVAGCLTTAHLQYDDTISGYGLGGKAFWDCCAFRGTGTTDANGRVEFYFPFVQGRGHLSYSVTARCPYDIPIGGETWIPFTSTNLRGDPSGVTNVFSLALWAGGLPPGYDVYMDYTCDGTVDVYDLGFWASGLTVDCSTVSCP
jgi:hypothetical protein